MDTLSMARSASVLLLTMSSATTERPRPMRSAKCSKSKGDDVAITPRMPKAKKSAADGVRAHSVRPSVEKVRDRADRSARQRGDVPDVGARWHREVCRPAGATV